MDGGVTFREKGWKRWGSQIRRTSDEDRWSIDDGGRKIAFESVLRDLDRKRFFEVLEEVEVTEEGIQFSYKLKALVSLSAEAIGAEFHLPIEETRAKSRSVMHGNREVAIPAEGTKALLGVYTANEFSLIEGKRAVARVSLPKPTRWFLLDDRPFNLNLARSQFVVPTKVVSPGDEIAMSFTLQLSDVRQDLAVRVGQTQWFFDKMGRFVLEGPGGRCRGRLCILDDGDPDAVRATGVGLSSDGRPVRWKDGSLYFAGSADLGDEGKPFPYRMKVEAAPSDLRLLYRFKKRDATTASRLGLFIEPEGRDAELTTADEDGDEEAAEWTLTFGRTAAAKIVLPRAVAAVEVGEGEGQAAGFWIPLGPVRPSANPDVVTQSILFRVPSEPKPAGLPEPAAMR